MQFKPKDYSALDFLIDFAVNIETAAATIAIMNIARVFVESPVLTGVLLELFAFELLFVLLLLPVLSEPLFVLSC